MESTQKPQSTKSKRRANKRNDTSDRQETFVATKASIGNDNDNKDNDDDELGELE